MIEKITEALKEFFVEIYQDPRYPSCAISVEVEGDWKHDHLAVLNILKEYGYNEVKEELISNCDSDYYTSVHVMLPMPASTIEVLKNMVS